MYVILDQSQIDVVKAHRDRLQQMCDNLPKYSTSAKARHFEWIKTYDNWLQEFNLK